MTERGDSVSGRSPGSQEKYSAREMAPWFLGLVVMGAVAPRVVYFKGRVRGRALAIYTAWDTLTRFALMQWVAPWAREQSARFEDAREQLTRELGREPPGSRSSRSSATRSPDPVARVPLWLSSRNDRNLMASGAERSTSMRAGDRYRTNGAHPGSVVAVRSE